MRQALQKTWPVTVIGLALTAFIAGAVYYFESEALTNRAQARTEQILNRAKNRFQQLVWHVGLTADYLKTSQPRWTQDSLSNFLARLEPDMPQDSSWIVSEVLPKSAAELERAPVVFASPQWIGKLAGFDIFSVAELGALRQTEQSQAAEKARLDFLSSGFKDDYWKSGSILVTQNVPSESGNQRKFILSRIVPTPEISALLEIDDGRTFAVQNPDVPDVIVGNAALLGGPTVLTRNFDLQDLRLRMTLEPVVPLRPSVWLPILIIGTLLTSVVSLALISKHLGLRLRHDSDQLSGARLSLSQIKNSEEALFENAGTANCLVEPITGRFLRVNSRLVELLGYSADELLKMRLADIVHPDDVAASNPASENFTALARPYIQFEQRYLHKNGTVVYCLVNSRAIQSLNGSPEAFATAIIDISEAKAQERLRDNLVRELAHRVRNNVQLTATIARQTAKTARSVRDFDDKFQKRLNALRAAQDALFDTNWTAAPLDMIIKRSLAPFQQSEAVRLEVSVPPILLPPQHAQTVAIAVHELAANSNVWGALSRNGRAKLAGRVENTKLGEVLILDWTEESDFVVKPPKKRGFGMRMLEIGLPEQFAGTAELKWKKNGLDYRATLPLANAKLA